MSNCCTRCVVRRQRVLGYGQMCRSSKLEKPSYFYLLFRPLGPSKLQHCPYLFDIHISQTRWWPLLVNFGSLTELCIRLLHFFQPHFFFCLLIITLISFHKKKKIISNSDKIPSHFLLNHYFR